ncbi:serine/threonine-protein phosphatase 6 regulatory ankyrin repeat subunit A [Drosophila yakuba]|uniref:serine/threonine-protein phosphatase 6 regulatory ankyrin repeat subunit A n=1 Tax=Drosophila yakuba TaxID=7245 RepID=UPI0019307607|nr:serine/threonine-protein phosphatase 6 regulatory ankyrin repeat subunit A [Drosophila yakuba]
MCSTFKKESNQSEDGLTNKLDQEECELLWPNFVSRISSPTVNSLHLHWSLLKNASVYRIDKFHKRLGWLQLDWTSSSPITVTNLEENFGYRLRIKALAVSKDKRQYVPLATSPEIIACTAASLPSTHCLSLAIKKGQQFLVKRMLRRRPSLIEYPASNGFLPLANAIIQGEMCIIDLLLSAGCSVHIGNPESGRTPLHLAFYYGHQPSARILLNKKARLEATDSNGMTPAHCAVDANQLEMVKFALEAKANVEARDIYGWTLLMRAVVMNASMELIKVLVTHGADLATLDGVGNTCTDLAKLYHRQDAKDYFDKVQKFRLEKSDATADAVAKAQMR